jgi:hypothetical protein
MNRAVVFSLTVALVLSAASPAPAQDSTDGSGYDKLAAEWSRLYQQYGQIGMKGTTYDPTPEDQKKRAAVWARMEELKRQMDGQNRQRAADVNDGIPQLSLQRDRLASQTGFMNNVISYRKRDDLDNKVEELRRKWDAQYGPRIGIVNPYTGSSYYRYYNDKGDLVVTKVKGDYELLERQRADWEQSYRRARWALDSVQGDYDKLQQQYGYVTALKAWIDAQRTPRRPLADNPRTGSGDSGDNRLARPNAGAPAGPFRLFTGAYSNTADLRGGGSGTAYSSLADARAAARKHMSGSAGSQPSYRIEDKDGKVIEARGLIRNIRPR